ncbi:MAG: DNA polymerase III subunit beta [Candidatus Vogelbacteria bacterium]|nr:DNA polymerase III subunit beta [Candidatus Vogelbacteria bacterium]
MKVECLKDKLRQAIAIADRITGKNLSLAALGHVFLEAKDHTVIVRTTNLDLGIEINLPVKVAKAGVALVNSGVIHNFLNHLATDEVVKLEVVNDNLTISTEHSASVIKAYPPDDFPTIPRLGQAASFTVPAQNLASGLRATIYAASLSDIKPEIASVYFYYDEERRQHVFVATDSFRLAEKRLTGGAAAIEAYKLIIPIKNAAEILRVFESSAAEVIIKHSANQAAFESGELYLTSRLVEGVFPDYRQVVPSSALSSVVVLKNDLLNALKLSNVFSDKLNQINLRVMAQDNVFEINSQNSDVGESSTRLEAAIQGEAVDISFNVKYLLDCLPAVASDSVHLQFNGKTRPILVSGVGDPSFSYLIMPLNR